MGEKGRIVIVDDDEDLLEVLGFYFGAKGFTIERLTSGSAAEKYIFDANKMADVALLILDRVLPDMDGVEMLPKFIETYKKKIPVLILSKLKADKDVLEGLKKGAVDYIGKPFNPEVLVEKALSLMARASNV